MASPAISEASEIRRRGRQRLIGAIALVAVLVVFVPMLLDSEPRAPRTEPALAIPSKTDSPALPKPAPAIKAVEGAPAIKAVENAPATAAGLAAKPPPAEPAKAVPPAKVATVEARPGAAEKGAKAGTPAAEPKLEGFAVQVGAFRDEAKLAQARQKLTAAGVRHYTERLDAAAGPLTRLRAGPFPTREAAESALATLKRSALDGKVVALP